MNTLHPSAAEVSFRVRPLGFDKGEVQAFISNLLNDYAQVTRELDRLRNEMAVMRETAPERRPVEVTTAVPAVALAAAPVTAAPAPVAPSAAGATAREVERILAGAERIAEEMRARAAEESEALRRDAEVRATALLRDTDTHAAATKSETEARAASLLQDAEVRATAALQEAESRAAELVRDAQARAAELVDGAAQQVVELDRQATAIRAQCAHMRAAFRTANDAAATALRAIGAMEEDPVPALQSNRA